MTPRTVLLQTAFTEELQILSGKIAFSLDQQDPFAPPPSQPPDLFLVLPAIANITPDSSTPSTSIHHRRGYHPSIKNIIAAQKIVNDIRTKIPELYILGNPSSSVAVFGAKEGSGVDVLKVGDTMSEK